MLRKMLGNVASAVANDEDAGRNPLLAQREEKHILLVLVTSDKGLAGAFNTNLIKAAQRFSAEHPGAAVRMVLIGRKGRDFFRKRGATVVSDYTNMAAKLVYADVAAIAGTAMDLYRKEEIDSVYLIYNEFKSVVAQTLVTRRVLPIELPEQTNPADYIFEQSPIAMLDALLPRYVETEFYRSLAESTAAEHAARMTAMEAATSNAGDMIDRLTLYMNRVRQASITKEIIEVVSGAAAAE
jgi:F-type H+-transporting ATPase subunit gamma